MITASVVAVVLERCERVDSPTCELCGGALTGDRGRDWAVHHRRFRDGRPDQDAPQNLLVVHGAGNVDACHGRIHRSKAEARTNGWAISRHGHTDPRTVPVLIDQESRWVYLTEDGDYEDPHDSMPVWLCDDGTYTTWQPEEEP